MLGAQVCAWSWTTSKFYGTSVAAWLEAGLSYIFGGMLDDCFHVGAAPWKLLLLHLWCRWVGNSAMKKRWQLLFLESTVNCHLPWRFTRKYFREKLGLELEPMVDVRLPERTVPRRPLRCRGCIGRKRDCPKKIQAFWRLISFEEMLLVQRTTFRSLEVARVICSSWRYILVFCKDISLLLYRCVARAKTPPYTGYGSWEDSMGSVTHLVPKLPKKERSMSGSKCTQRV